MIMRLIDTVGVLFSPNEIIALWEKEDKHHDILVWHGMAWDIPENYQNIDRWQIFGVIQDKITESDRINIKINDAVTLTADVDVQLLEHGNWEEYGYKWRCTNCHGVVNLRGTTPEENRLHFCPMRCKDGR